MGKLAIHFFILLSLLLAGCSEKPSYRAQGYIEGRYTYMATSVSGVLTNLFVNKGAQVKQGQPLFALEQQPESDTYVAAQESLQQAIDGRDAIAANLEYAKLTYERYKVLVPKKAIEQSQLDNAKSIYNSTAEQLSQANANIAEARALLAQAKWRFNQKSISAPVNAIVFDTYYRVGEYTIANQPILSLLAPENIKAIFYINEKQLGEIHLGDAVAVQCDACAKVYQGKIDYISPSAEYTPPVIFSTETNEKLIYRIEASFPAQEAVFLHPGQPVTVTYYSHE